MVATEPLRGRVYRRGYVQAKAQLSRAVSTQQARARTSSQWTLNESPCVAESRSPPSEGQWLYYCTRAQENERTERSQNLWSVEQFEGLIRPLTCRGGSRPLAGRSPRSPRTVRAGTPPPFEASGRRKAPIGGGDEKKYNQRRLRKAPLGRQKQQHQRL